VRPLPIDERLPEIVRVVAERGVLVLEAPPGAGKTTRVPPALLAALDSSEGDIVVLEPRRLAARMAAGRIAEERGERVGEAVGYQVRFEDKTSRATRIRFVTEGVFTRRLLSDPLLSRTRIVILDEFHERHLHGDVALAVAKRLRETKRPDLGVVVMSATLDSTSVADYLGAPILRTEGRAFEVAIEYAKTPDDRPLALQVAGAARTAVRQSVDGDILVFLPGAAEIRKAKEACEKMAAEEDLLLLPLHGDLPPAEQDRAVHRQAKRKVVLATNVAESSITIDGVVSVVDSGLARVAGHAPWSGLPTLAVAKISRASAAQRAGRAGRTRPGRCMRLYTQADWAGRPEHDKPEIERLDLAQTWLELASLGNTDLAWLDPPPEASLRAAVELLQKLGALDHAGSVTAMGKRLLGFPIHPRQARLLVEAEARGVAEDGAVLAALIGERDIRRSHKTTFGGPASHDTATERSDLLAALDLFREAEAVRFSPDALRHIGLDPGATHAVSRASGQLRVSRSAEPPESPKAAEDALLRSVLSGYPDRVVKRGQGRSLALAGGGSAELSLASVVRDAPWMVAVDAETQKGRALVHVASAIEPDWLFELFPERVKEVTEIAWDATAERAVARSRLAYEGLVLVESEASGAEADLAQVLFKAALARGARSFAPDGALDRWLARARFAARYDPRVGAPDEGEIESVLRQACTGKKSFAELRESSFVDALEARLAPEARARVAALTPERVTLAGGRAVRVEYELDKAPWIASRLQDFFGMEQGPSVAQGKVPLVLHLLAPNQRAVQVTSDLSGFWDKHYPSVRKELGRKYRRHFWPDDPRRAVAPAPRAQPRKG
jgi:ATP-dependent helicase HrpB